MRPKDGRDQEESPEGIALTPFPPGALLYHCTALFSHPRHASLGMSLWLTGMEGIDAAPYGRITEAPGACA